MKHHYVVVVSRDGRILIEIKTFTLEDARARKKKELDYDKTLAVKIYELVEVE